MSLNDKYRNALDLGKKFNIADGYVKEENGVLKIGGKAKNQLEKDLIWDAVKKSGGDNPNDVKVDIDIDDDSIYGLYTVESGDSLSKISKMAYGDSNQYMKIFEANRDKLSDPDKIQAGQKLIIPN